MEVYTLRDPMFGREKTRIEMSGLGVFWLAAELRDKWLIWTVGGGVEVYAYGRFLQPSGNLRSIECMQMPDAFGLGGSIFDGVDGPVRP